MKTPPPVTTWSGLTGSFSLIVALALATGTDAFTSSAVSIALPRIAASFAASSDEISWAVTLYLAGYAVVLPLTAWLSDVLGQRRYVAISLLVYFATSLGCMVATSLPVFLILRTLQGAAGACFLARSIFTFTKEFRPPVLFSVFFLFIAAFSLRGVGLPLGGYLAENVSWRWLFAIPVLVIAWVALPALYVSREIWPRRRPLAPDLVGLGLLTVGFGALLIALFRGERDEWLSSPVIVGLSVTAILAVPLFVLRESRVSNRERMISVASLRYRGMGIGVTLSFLAGLMMVGGVYVLPIFFLRIVGCDAYRTGWLMSIDAFSMMAGLALAVCVIRHVLTRSLLTASGILFASAMWLFASRVTSGSPIESFFLPMILHGIGVGLSLPPIGIFSFRALGSNQDHNSEGRAWHYTARQFGGVVAVAIAVVVLDRRSTVHSGELAAGLTATSPLLKQTLGTVVHGLTAHGLATAASYRGAMALIGGIVRRESMVLAFRDLFLGLSLIGVAVSGLSFAMPKLRGAPGTKKTDLTPSTTTAPATRFSL